MATNAIIRIVGICLLLTLVDTKAEGTFEEDCNILIKLDTLESRLHEQELNLLRQDARISEQAVSLAEKDFRISELENSLSDKIARIKELEGSLGQQTSDLESYAASLSNVNTRITELEKNLAEQSDRMEEIENDMSQQAATLGEIGITLSGHETEIIYLKERTGSARTVGFSATSPRREAAMTTQMGFSIVHSNVGGGFNASIGIFTCPVAGMYFFSASLLKGYAYDGSASCSLFKGGTTIGTAFTYPGHSPREGNYAAVTSVYVHLDVGEIVTLAGCWTPIKSAFSQYSTFSGFLVTPSD